MSTYSFPIEGTSQAKEIPAYMVFYYKEYSTYNSGRLPSTIMSSGRWVKLPYPKIFSISNDMKYEAGGSLVQEMNNLQFSARENADAFNQRIDAFLQGGSAITPDHMETFLMPGSRRVYNISFDLVAKTEADANVASEIARVFQSNAFPRWTGGSKLVWQHPPLWQIKVAGNGQEGSTLLTQYWDGNALPAVLKNVDINRAPILQTPFITEVGAPLALNINLQFYELEPAVYNGAKLINRANVFN
jgi:hypothetical protein